MFFAAAIVVSVMTIYAAPAGAITVDEARTQCRAQYSGRSAWDEAQRTGVSLSQRVTDCIKEAMRQNKKH